VTRSWDTGGLNSLWVGDIERLPTWQGWPHVAMVINAILARQVVGWAIDQHMRADLARDALAMAITLRGTCQTRSRSGAQSVVTAG
jgi:putative transposase